MKKINNQYLFQKNERRKYPRYNVITAVKVYNPHLERPSNAVTFDISEGGIKIVTSTRLIKDEKYLLSIGQIKIHGLVTYEEIRTSSIMHKYIVYYYGLRFSVKINSKIINKILTLGKSVSKPVQ